MLFIQDYDLGLVIYTYRQNLSYFILSLLSISWPLCTSLFKFIYCRLSFVSLLFLQYHISWYMCLKNVFKKLCFLPPYSSKCKFKKSYLLLTSAVRTDWIIAINICHSTDWKIGGVKFLLDLFYTTRHIPLLLSEM